MKGLKEILISAAVALFSLFGLAKLTTQLKADRQFIPAEPTMITPPPVYQPADEIQLNWGLKAIHAEHARRTNQAMEGHNPVIVAVIDTGCDINHLDLAKNIWTNPGETGVDPYGNDKSSNGIDDDDNGFVDDVHGWDFVTDSPAVMDDHGHGTHIAGIVKNVAPQVSLMILKYFDAESTGPENLIHTIQAIDYAVHMGANIINYSGGGIIKSPQEEQALRYAADHQVLLVAAAGNEGLNSDFFHFYPADYELPNILSVAAIDRQERLLNLSNFGRGTVDVAAPGRNIYSTLPNSRHGYMSGTSQATAFVTGVAALMMAQDQRYADPRILRQRLLTHGRTTASLKDKIGPGQMLDADMALHTNILEISRLND